MATVLEPAITMGEQGYPIHKLTSAGVQTLLDLDSTIAWHSLCFQPARIWPAENKGREDLAG